MPDSEELDEILKEIKNINAPKEKPEPKEEQPLTLADDKPAKEEAEAKPEPVKENVNFNDFSSFNSAQHSDIPKDNKGEKKMPKKKGKNKKPLIIAIVVENDYPIAKFAPTVISPGKLAFKRLVDIIGGIVGTILSLPIILIVAIPLKLESSGPLIFKQQRVGKNGRIFNIYKLRSMYEDAEERKKVLQEQNQMDGHMFKMDNDPRITKVGKFIRKTSIDELPQFWNVLKGDMSLVGTRPPTIDEFEKYESHHKRRLSMKPGITGKWQVSGRSNIKNFEDVVKLDCEYIDEWSPILDIQILIKTVGVVLTHKGAE